MNYRTVFGGLIIIASASSVIISCKSRSSSETDAAATTYEGETFRSPSMQNVVSDTVFNFAGESITVTRISRSIEQGNPNFSISLDVYAYNGNDAVNSALASYISDVVSSFNTEEKSDTVRTVVSVPVDVAKLTALIDTTATSFASTVIPKAIADSVPGANLAVDLRPVWADGKYVTYSMASQCYYGGAHGENDFYLLTFDRKSGVPMGFYNLVPHDRQQQVRSQLVETISRDNGLSVDEYLKMVNEWMGAGESEPLTVDNFPIYHVALTGQGYVFCYPKYSIAPGSEGCPIYVLSAK